MPLDLFYTIVQKSQKWPKTQIKGGSCLKQTFVFFMASFSSFKPGRRNWTMMNSDVKFTGALDGGY